MLKLGALIVAAALAASTSQTSQPPTVSGRSQHQAPSSGTNKQQQATYGGQRGTEDAPIVIKILPSEIPASGSTEKSDQQDHQPPHDWWIIVPNILLTLFTGGLFWYTAKLWRSTTKLIGEERSASERELRAYVHIRIYAVPYPKNNPTLYSVRLAVTNGGKTWARNLRMEKAVVTDFTGDPFDRLKADRDTLPPLVLGPGQSLKLQFTDIPFAVRDAIHTGAATVDLVVWATYEDTLSSPPVLRQTQVSQRVNIDAGGGISLTYRDTHNCVDGDCSP
ncbi:MAG: hypothetical protein ABSD74_01155 [Rhizomicrobium sp.]|jgi:hypothetical protein